VDVNEFPNPNGDPVDDKFDPAVPKADDPVDPKADTGADNENMEDGLRKGLLCSGC
jgi:hypothetical protein